MLPKLMQIVAGNRQARRSTQMRRVFARCAHSEWLICGAVELEQRLNSGDDRPLMEEHAPPRAVTLPERASQGFAVCPAGTIRQQR
jgi:hypothetical protein